MLKGGLNLNVVRNSDHRARGTLPNEIIKDKLIDLSFVESKSS